ncbi:hypothetical protein, partial [Escherichia sp. E2748]|uniref:hypothetical protein n=1 Tax=Escherichia sp. E2748 TaxID=2044460 RepID=UPI00197AC4C4
SLTDRHCADAGFFIGPDSIVCKPHSITVQTYTASLRSVSDSRKMVTVINPLPEREKLASIASLPGICLFIKIVIDAIK